MKGLRLLFAIALIAAFGTGTAYAQPQRIDHLKCYKVKDPAKFTAGVTLEALQTQFGVEDCKLAGKAQFFCVPVDKTVTAFTDKSKTPLTPSSFPAQKLEEDRLCYKIKCPKKDIANELVTDQFGSRSIGKFVPMMLCTPARKGPIDDPQPCDATNPQCNGLCPDPADICRPSVPPGTCTCVPPPHPPCDATAPQCNGDCPNPADICRPNAAGVGCSCTRPPTPCSATAVGAAPQCNGDCPTGTRCVQTSTGKCDCFDPRPCQSSAPTCGGTCAAGQQCIPQSALGGCICQ